MKDASESGSSYCGQSGMLMSPTNKRGNENGDHESGVHIRLDCVRQVLRFFGGDWKQVSVFGGKPPLDDDTESNDSGLSGVSDCKPVCFVGCNPVGVAGAYEFPKPHSALNSSMGVGCNPVGVAGADESSEPHACSNSSMVTNVN